MPEICVLLQLLLLLLLLMIRTKLFTGYDDEDVYLLPIMYTSMS